MQKLTLVLPIRIDVDRESSDLDRFIALGLPSLQRFIDKSCILELIVVASKHDIYRISRHLAPLCVFSFRIVDEDRLCPAIAGSRGWYKQQILKLAIAPLIETEWYLIIDSDVICIRQVHYTDLIQGGRAIWQKEPASLHLNWWRGSENILQVPTAVCPDELVIGVTPELMHAESVIQLICRIHEIYSGTDWTVTLLKSTEPWTEYTLYWTYLLYCNRRHSLYSESETKLYLADSIWHKDQLAKLGDDWLKKAFDPSAQYFFLIFQSNMNIPLSETVRLLRRMIGGPPEPSMAELLCWQRHTVYYRLRHYFRALKRKILKIASVASIEKELI
jgi:Family of unknown function (DUF6492)